MERIKTNRSVASHVFEDSDGDGKADKSHVFVEGLVMVGRLLWCAEDCWSPNLPSFGFTVTQMATAKRMRKTEVATDYGNRENPEHTANGLMLGLAIGFTARTTRRGFAIWMAIGARTYSVSRQWGIQSG